MNIPPSGNHIESSNLKRDSAALISKNTSAFG